MSRIVYLNGDYLPEAEARVSIFDRGFVMADAVYEVTSVLGGKLIDFPGHYARLKRSLAELSIAEPVTEAELLAMNRALVEKNAITDGMVYLQITRGNPGDRDFLFPEATLPATVVAYTQEHPGLEQAPKPKAVITLPDIRWGRRDIKTVQLLYPSMAKTMAVKAGADDAWLVDEEGFVTEGTSNNAYIVKGGRIITRPLSQDILHGITRAAIVRLARESQMEVEERPFTVEEAKAADEAFVTSASQFATPVVSIDGTTVGSGQPGATAERLRDIYLDEMRKTAM